MANPFLYGLRVQGIQRFIFETGKLKEIIGASEFVEQICYSKFLQALQSLGSTSDQASLKENILVSAAGKIIYLFDTQEECEKLARVYLRQLKKEVPGISVVQAAVSLDKHAISTALEELDRRLDAQIARGYASHGEGIMISRRSRRTSKPGVAPDYLAGGDALLDRNQVAKRKYAESQAALVEKLYPPNDLVFPTDISEIANEGDWIAVIHADGNNLGKVVQSLHKEIRARNDDKGELLKEFSKALNTASQLAAQDAFNQVVKEKVDRVAPLRPIVLAGDDLSLIIRGDLALDFTHEYLARFQVRTEEAFSALNLPALKRGLTACAGIAYIKPNYPIHYGMGLAESLTKSAKKISKQIAQQNNAGIIPASLLFHKVQSAFVEDFDAIIQRELRTKQEVYFNYGPYFLEPQTDDYVTISELRQWVAKAHLKDAPTSSFRQWLNALHDSKAKAIQVLERINRLNNKRVMEGLRATPRQVFHRKTDGKHYTHIHDIITIESLMK